VLLQTSSLLWIRWGHFKWLLLLAGVNNNIPPGDQLHALDHFLFNFPKVAPIQCGGSFVGL